jgi:hypothetical protein
MKTLTIVPAYGRDYKNKQACLEDWNNGKDFQIYSGPYCSNRDIETLRGDGYTHLSIRYAKLTRVVQIKL